MNIQHRSQSRAERGSTGGGFVAGAGLAVAVIGLVATGVTFASEPERPDLNVAREFANQYYGLAPQNSSITWAMTSSAWKRVQATRDPAVTKKSYGEYWDGIDHVVVKKVTRSTEGDNLFDVELWFYDSPEDTKVGPSFQRLELECPWMSRLPWEHCTGSDALLDANTFIEDD